MRQTIPGSSLLSHGWQKQKESWGFQNLEVWRSSWGLRHWYSRSSERCLSFFISALKKFYVVPLETPLGSKHSCFRPMAQKPPHFHRSGSILSENRFFNLIFANGPQIHRQEQLLFKNQMCEIALYSYFKNLWKWYLKFLISMYSFFKICISMDFSKIIYTDGFQFFAPNKLK